MIQILWLKYEAFSFMFYTAQYIVLFISRLVYYGQHCRYLKNGEAVYRILFQNS